MTSSTSHSSSDPVVSPFSQGLPTLATTGGGPIVSPLSSSLGNQHFYLQECQQSAEREALPSTAEWKYKGHCGFLIMTNTWETAGLASELQTHNLTAPSGARIPVRTFLCLLPVLPHCTWLMWVALASPARLSSTCLGERQVTPGRGSISKGCLSLRETTAWAGSEVIQNCIKYLRTSWPWFVWCSVS